MIRFISSLAICVALFSNCLLKAGVKPFELKNVRLLPSRFTENMQWDPAC